MSKSYPFPRLGCEQREHCEHHIRKCSEWKGGVKSSVYLCVSILMRAIFLAKFSFVVIRGYFGQSSKQSHSGKVSFIKFIRIYSYLFWNKPLNLSYFQWQLMAVYFWQKPYIASFREIRSHGVNRSEAVGKGLLGKERRTQGRTGGKKGVIVFKEIGIK